MNEINSSGNDAISCECKAEEIILLPCAGGSNCGQITNHVAVNLDTLGIGRIYCLAGIAAHIDGMVESARGARRIVVLDGCNVACGKIAVEHTGLKVTDWICVTEEGISKNHDFSLKGEDIEAITQRTRELLAKPAQARV